MLTGESELKKEFEKMEQKKLRTHIAALEKRIRELEQRPICPCKAKEECKGLVVEKTKKRQMTPQPWPMPASLRKTVIGSATKEKKENENKVSLSSIPRETTEREEKRVAKGDEALKEGLPLDEVVKMEQEEDSAKEQVEGAVIKIEDIDNQIDSTPEKGEEAVQSNGDDAMEGMLEKNHGEGTQETEPIGCQYNSILEKKEEGQSEMEGETCDSCNSVHPEDSEWCSLFDAIRNNDISAVRAFIRHGAELGECEEKWTPLALAAVLGRQKIVAELLQAGANISSPGVKSAIHFSSVLGNAAMVQLLLEHGTDVNLQDTDGNTALHCAANFGKEDIVRLLLKRGVDPFAKNWDGKTALDYAKGLKRADIVAVLEKHLKAAAAKK